MTEVVDDLFRLAGRKGTALGLGDAGSAVADILALMALIQHDIRERSDQDCGFKTRKAVASGRDEVINCCLARRCPEL